MSDLERRQDQDYEILVQSVGGSNYLDIFRQFRQDRLPVKSLGVRNPKHAVFQVRHQGRDYLIKVDREQPKHLENKLWRLLCGPVYSRQMRAVRRAILGGCRAVPDIYLVAEQRGGPLGGESVILMEFVAGRQYYLPEDLQRCRAAVLEALADLHRHGLALGDCNESNFIFNEGKCVLIDLSWRGLPCVGRAQDIVSLKKHYGWDLPPTDPATRLAIGYIKLKKGLRSWLRRLRGKPPKSDWRLRAERPVDQPGQTPDGLTPPDSAERRP